MHTTLKLGVSILIINIHSSELNVFVPLCAMRDYMAAAGQNCRRAVACRPTMGIQNGLNTARHRRDQLLAVLDYGKPCGLEHNAIAHQLCLEEVAGLRDVQSWVIHVQSSKDQVNVPAKEAENIVSGQEI